MHLCGQGYGMRSKQYFWGRKTKVVSTIKYIYVFHYAGSPFYNMCKASNKAFE
jgi:hypothetical protein